jgi:MFS family permease
MTAFLICSALLLAAAIGIALLLRPALVSVLTDVCGSERRAAFWAQYSVVMVPLATLLGALFGGLPGGAGGTAFDPADALTLVRSGVFGLLIVLIAEALVLMRGIAAFERRREDAWRLAQPPRPPQG